MFVLSFFVVLSSFLHIGLHIGVAHLRCSCLCPSPAPYTCSLVPQELQELQVVSDGFRSVLPWSFSFPSPTRIPGHHLFDSSISSSIGKRAPSNPCSIPSLVTSLVSSCSRPLTLICFCLVFCGAMMHE